MLGTRPQQDQGRQRNSLFLQSTLTLFLSLSVSVHHFSWSFLPYGAKAVKLSEYQVRKPKTEKI